MSREKKTRRALVSLKNYATFFFLSAFLITSSMELFLHAIQGTLEITYTEAGIRWAAILTFGNVIFLSLLLTVLDGVRRRFMVDRPVRRIVEGAEKIMKGDLSARIKPFHSIDTEEGFDTIIDCFNRMAEELSGLETLRTDFIANVSHELKTPLAVMQNYAALLQAPNLPEEQRLQYARSITEQSQRLADLISNILKLNRLENQTIYPAVQQFNLGEQLADCLLGFESTWEKKQIEIETDLEEDVLVESDAELLSLIWNNLFSNALKFTEPGGTVSLSLKTERGTAVVQVSDTGCGIRPEVGKHIFEKFYQGDTSHAAQGNGLGLALVKRVLDIVGGEISVESEAGKGSTFTVRIQTADTDHGKDKQKA